MKYTTLFEIKPKKHIPWLRYTWIELLIRPTNRDMYYGEHFKKFGLSFERKPVVPNINIIFSVGRHNVELHYTGCKDYS